MPISIDSNGFEFDLVALVPDAGSDTCEFNMFLEVKNVLIIYPVKIDIRVVEGLKPTEPEAATSPETEPEKSSETEPEKSSETEPSQDAELSTVD